MDDYFNLFINPNKDEKDQRDSEFRVCRIRAEINGIEKDIERVRERVRAIKSSIDEML